MSFIIKKSNHLLFRNINIVTRSMSVLSSSRRVLLAVQCQEQLLKQLPNNISSPSIIKGLSVKNNVFKFKNIKAKCQKS